MNFDDPVSPILTVRRAVAKSDRVRHVPLNETALETLKGWREQTTSKQYVFVNPRTGGPFGHVNTAWRAILKTAKIHDFTWHSLRHSFASRLVLRGIDLYTIKELLGHASIQQTEVYSHISPAQTRAAVAALDTPQTTIFVPFSADAQRRSP